MDIAIHCDRRPGEQLACRSVKIGGKFMIAVVLPAPDGAQVTAWLTPDQALLASTNLAGAWGAAHYGIPTPAAVSTAEAESA